MSFKKMIQIPMMISLSSGLLYLGQLAYGESGNWEICLSESDLSCAIDIRKKRGVDIPKAKEELENLSKSDLELLSGTLFHEGKYQQLELVLDALSYPENTPDEEPHSEQP